MASLSKASAKSSRNSTANTNIYTPITQGLSHVIKCLFEIYHGRDGLESFCTKYDINPRSMHSYLTVCNIPANVMRIFKKVGWFYESKMGFSIYIKYPVMVTKNLIETSMTLPEFAEKHKLNKVLVKNFFNENPILSQSVLDACKKDGVWYECYTKTPMELRQLVKERLNDEEGGLGNYLFKIQYTHRDSYWDYFGGNATPDKLEKKLKLDGYLIR